MGRMSAERTSSEAFADIARRVADRPQDTVVVFLAGHTGVFNPQRFCLLLPDFPFPENEPIQVAVRDLPPNAGENDKIDDQFVLPYSVIEVGPGAAQGPQSAGDRRRLPGRVDPR